MLSIEKLHVSYGPINALKGISMEVGEGEIVTLIGSNGAGKSTTLGAITGLVRAASGAIRFRGKDITNLPPYKIVEAGISLSPEGREVFPALTVHENLKLGAYTRGDKSEIDASFDRVYELFPRLRERALQTAGTLSGGEQQMLAIGRALMSRPRLLLLDEPSMGLAPNLVLMIFDLIESINKQGTTILLIEQNANMALSIAHRAYVLETGNIAISGPAAELSEDPRVKNAYLGGNAHCAEHQPKGETI
ncbi:ABC transporter ATP-binding protein [Bacillota bacterium Meth-B3]